MEDTIVALATTVGISALNIIKVSGKESIRIVNSIFKGKDLRKVSSHTIHYGFIIDDKELIDEVLISVFLSPKSYTTEDVLEIGTHGGVSTTNKILELLLKKGARLAEPGEFLKRAYLNGRIDLIEAESVQDLILAKTENARKISVKGISGEVSKLINNIRKKITTILANIEVNIDYPEYEDAIKYTNEMLNENTEEIKKEISNILSRSKNSRLIKNGINVAIVGKPNAGKSSLLNVLLDEDKAIVTDVKGTTRDINEGSVVLNGTQVNFIDTAGIRVTTDLVEKLGVDRSIKAIEEADLILFLLDQETGYEQEDKNIYEKIKSLNFIIIANKSDIKNNKFPFDKIIEISTVNKNGINDLKNLIINTFGLKEIGTSDFTYLSNARQIGILDECYKIIKEIEQGILENKEIDLIEIDLKILWEKLGEITGETYKDELLDELFNSFCLGK